MAAPAPSTTTTTSSTSTVSPSTGAASSSAAPAIKVFVGNLSFKTKDTDLQSQFESAGGKVVRANVIRDYQARSLGYGFVEMATIEDAKRAVEAMNKKELDGRQINVELAKPRDESKTNNTEGGDNARRGGARGTRGTRGGARGGSRGGRGGRRSEGADNNGEQGQGQQQRQQRQPRQDRPAQEDRTPSKTVLFVSNLPFSMDDASFTKIFTDHKFNVKKATVVKRANGRSKGYGFIELENEDTQQKALAAVNGQELEGRKLTVRIALTEMHDVQSGKTEQGSSPAPQQQTQQQQPQQQQQSKPAGAPAQQQQQQAKTTPTTQSPATSSPKDSSKPAAEKKQPAKK